MDVAQSQITGWHIVFVGDRGWLGDGVVVCPGWNGM
jgi:hypothetical protein